MKSFSHYFEAGPIPYRDLPVRLLVALVAAHWIVSFSEPESFWQLLRLPGYLPALISSFLIALVLVEWVYRITCWLDKHYTYQKRPETRIILQVVFGILVPVILSFILDVCYFSSHGISIFDTPYFKHYLPLILIMLLLWNTYYGIHYFVRLLIRIKKINMEKKEATPQSPPVKLKSQLDPANVMLIFSEKKHNYCLLSDGERVYWPHSIEHALSQLPREEFFQITRSQIVSRTNIISAKKHTSRRILISVKVPKNQQSFVSQDNSPAFITWWGKPIDT